MGDGVLESPTKQNMKGLERQPLVGMAKADRGLMMYMKLMVRIITNYLPISGKIRRFRIIFPTGPLKLHLSAFILLLTCLVKLALNCLKLPCPIVVQIVLKG